MGITDVEIIGYPADILEKYNNQVIALKPEDIEEFKWVMLTELDKIVRYKDVGDMNIPNNSGQLKDEPIVLVKKENATLQELLQNLKKTNPQEGHQSNPQTSTLGEK